MRKFLVLGHARHGKDTVAEYLAKELGLSYKGSSEVCAEFIFKELAGYKSVQECFEDRSNHRVEWFQIITDYCRTDKARLGRLIYETNDIYSGVRAKDELDAVIEEFSPFVIWVDAAFRLPLESNKSMQLLPYADYRYIDNNKDEEHLYKQLDKLIGDLNG